MANKASSFCGHGTQTNGVYDSGCTYNGYTEANLCMKITEACNKYLKLSGITVVTDAPGNKINMIAQVAKSNSEKSKIHVAFHCDYSLAPSGTLPLYTSAAGKKLAGLMNTYVVKEVKMKTRGLGYREDLYELNATNMPSVIFECGSIKADLKVMRDKYDAIGKACAHGICKYFGVPFVSKATYTGIIPVKNLQVGSEGAPVKRWQKFLNWAVNAKLTVDGDFGELTKKATIKFQKKAKVTQSGKLDKATRTAAKKFKK